MWTTKTQISLRRFSRDEAQIMFAHLENKINDMSKID